MPGSNSSDALAIGSLVHAGRARWFALNFEVSAEAWNKVVEAVDQEIAIARDTVSKKAKEQALIILEQFIRHWSTRPLPEPIATEYLLGPAPLELGDPTPLWRTSKPDDISRYPEGGSDVWLGDLKTTSGSIADCVKEYELHGQFLQMMLLYKNSKQGEAKLGRAAGIMLDIVQKPDWGETDCKFARHAIVITDQSLQWFARGIKNTLRSMASVDWNFDAPRNITACTETFGKGRRYDCPYKSVCRFGKSAAYSFVYGPDDTPVAAFTLTKEKESNPWD